LNLNFFGERTESFLENPLNSQKGRPKISENLESRSFLEILSGKNRKKFYFK
jgi:hypothetical protein